MWQSAQATLLSEWIAQDKLPVGWLVLDADDNDPVRFWSYFIAALQQINAAIGSSSLALLQFPRDTTLETMLRTLVNEIDYLLNDRATEFTPSENGGHRLSSILVLDDYHVIEAPAIHQQLSFLLDHLPPHLHLVISTRADPSLHLARLRARDRSSAR